MIPMDQQTPIIVKKMVRKPTRKKLHATKRYDAQEVSTYRISRFLLKHIIPKKDRISD